MLMKIHFMGGDFSIHFSIREERNEKKFSAFSSFCRDFNETDRLKYLYAQSFHGLCGIISLSLKWHSVVKLKKR